MDRGLQNLIDRGYSKEEVLSIASFSLEELDYFSSKALEINCNNCTSQENPVALYIGGQPGSGKTTISMNMKKQFPNIVEIGIDNYRMYHPNYSLMEECIKKHWENRGESINDTPGNDIADFTQQFSGQMTDEIVRKAIEKRYNIAVEWSMRDPREPLKAMSDLKNKGYDISVLFVAVDKETSMEACNIRGDVMNSHDILTRRITPSFHQMCIETLSNSVEALYEEGYKKGIIDKLNIINRSGQKLWDASKDDINPKDVYNSLLNNRNLTTNYNNSIYAEIAFEKEIEGMSVNTITNSNVK